MKAESQPCVFDPRQVDLQALSAGLDQIRRELDAGVGAADVSHLRRVERWGYLCSLIGYGTAWIVPNPVSAFFIHQGNQTRWVLMHHIGHGAYDRIPGVPRRFTKAVFAQGRRRLLDYMDWFLPSAWIEEHNHHHHAFLNDKRDPDLLEDRLAALHARRLPSWRLAILVGVMMTIWRWARFAPRTFVCYEESWARRHKRTPDAGHRLGTRSRTGTGARARFWRQCLFPNAIYRFVALPLVALPFGTTIALNVGLNLVLAEWIGNVLTYLLLVPGHNACDLYRFENSPASKGEWQLRQILGTCNFRAGFELAHFLLSYFTCHIEHHLWPAMTVRQYQHAKPKLAALCRRLNIPFNEEAWFTRVRKSMPIVWGTARNRRMTHTTMPDHVAPLGA